MKNENLKLRNASDANRLYLRKTVGAWSAGTRVIVSNFTPLVVRCAMSEEYILVERDDLVIRRARHHAVHS